MAERLAADAGRRVLVIDRRPHVAGNAFDERDANGILLHRYGPHLFHTNSDDIWAYLSRFTEWQPYEHRVLAEVRGQLVPLPINRTTVNRLYGLQLDGAGVEAFLAERAEPVEKTLTSEDVVVAKVGRELYELFFQGYTRKLWARDPSELASTVTGRIPVRFDDDDRYFTDPHQALPVQGYTAMFERILDHPNIEVRLQTDFEDVRDEIAYGHLVWTGPIDAWFHHRLGRLPYRSLRFEWETRPTPGGGWVQPVTQVNQPAEAVPFLRQIEFRHLYGTVADVSVISREYPSDEGDPYYPVPAPEARELYHRYEALAAAEQDITFVGRLARYQYLNMDQVVGQALKAYAGLRERLEAVA
jgi:UDP-galactopyranose mutase